MPFTAPYTVSRAADTQRRNSVNAIRGSRRPVGPLFQTDNSRGILTVWVLCGLLLLTMATGCTRQQKIDLAGMRAEHLAGDLPLLDADPQLPARPLSLDDVVAIGLQRNLDIRVSRILAEVTDAETVAEKLKMLPRLEVGVDGAHRNNYEIKSYEDLDTGEIVLSRSVSEERDRLLAHASLSWNLLDFGFSYYRSRQAAYARQAQRMERIRQAQKLALDIAAAYWKAVAAERGVKQVQQAEDELRTFKATVGRMAAERRVDAVAMKLLEKKLVDLALTARKLQANVSGARIDLCRLMGLRPSAQFELADASLGQSLDRLPPPDRLEARQLETVALNQRPELFASDLEQHIRRDEARAKLLAMFPGLRLDFTGRYDSNQYLDNNQWRTVGLGLASDLLALPAKYFSWKAAGRDADQAQAERLLLTAGIIAQVHLAAHAFAVESDQHRLYEQSRRLCSELLDMSRLKAEAGSLTDMALVARLLEDLVARLESDRSAVRLLEAYHRMLVTLGLDYGQWGQTLAGMDAAYGQPPEDIHQRDIF